MPRRISFLISVLAVACARTAQTPAPAGLSPADLAAASQPRELLPDQQIQQVLNRLAFGARPGDVAKVRVLGVDKWIDLQLHPDRIDDRAADAVVASYPSLAAKTDDIVRDFQTVQQARRQTQRADSLGKKDARQMLAEIYNWFAEGFDTADLTEAKALLAELNAGLIA